MAEVEDPWTGGVDVTEYTHTDLDQSRTKPMALSDKDGLYQQMTETLRRVEDLETLSMTCDRALRIELAWAIDSDVVSFTRDDYDVAYTIPPEDWTSQMTIYRDTGLVNREAIDTSERMVNITTYPVVHKMASEAAEEEAYESMSAIVKEGLERQLGYKDITGFTFVTKLFATPTQRDLLKFLFTEADPETWYRKADFVDATPRSGEAVRSAIDRLIEFQIVEVRDPDARIRHYRLADSEPVELLQTWDDSVEVLTELLDTTARQELVSIFLDVADPNETYSQYAIREEYEIGYDALREHMDVFVRYGLLETHEGQRTTEYSLADGDLTQYFHTLDKILFEALKHT